VIEVIDSLQPLYTGRASVSRHGHADTQCAGISRAVWQSWNTAVHDNVRDLRQKHFYCTLFLWKHFSWNAEVNRSYIGRGTERPRVCTGKPQFYDYKIDDDLRTLLHLNVMLWNNLFDFWISEKVCVNNRVHYNLRSSQTLTMGNFLSRLFRFKSKGTS